jgi:hypothetical protein
LLFVVVLVLVLVPVPVPVAEVQVVVTVVVTVSVGVEFVFVVVPATQGQSVLPSQEKKPLQLVSSSVSAESRRRALAWVKGDRKAALRGADAIILKLSRVRRRVRNAPG